jgi:hypothetical protein
MTAISRWPSCLISCSQPSPVGGFAAELTVCSRKDGGGPARITKDGMLRFGMGAPT